MRPIHRPRIFVAAIAAGFLAACGTASGAGPQGGPVTEPELLTFTPHPGMVTVVLPPGEPSRRARSLAGIGCGSARAALISVRGDH